MAWTTRKLHGLRNSTEATDGRESLSPRTRLDGNARAERRSDLAFATFDYLQEVLERSPFIEDVGIPASAHVLADEDHRDLESLMDSRKGVDIDHGDARAADLNEVAQEGERMRRVDLYPATGEEEARHTRKSPVSGDKKNLGCSKSLDTGHWIPLLACGDPSRKPITAWDSVAPHQWRARPVLSEKAG